MAIFFDVLAALIALGVVAVWLSTRGHPSTNL